MSGSDLFTGTLDLLILKAVSSGPKHGYAIGRWIRDHSADVLDVHEGVLYPALHRLARKGLLSDRWGESGTGRRVRVYAITPTGRKSAKLQIARFREHSDAVMRVLEAR